MGAYDSKFSTSGVLRGTLHGGGNAAAKARNAARGESRRSAWLGIAGIVCCGADDVKNEEQTTDVCRRVPDAFESFDGSRRVASDVGAEIWECSHGKARDSGKIERPCP